MNWADIGGRTQSLHVVIEWNYGINIRILCKHFVVNRARVKENNRQLPHCKQCIAALTELIRESRKTVQLEFSRPRESIKEMQEDASGFPFLDPFFAEGIKGLKNETTILPTEKNPTENS
jgi:hypothetical protein